MEFQETVKRRQKMCWDVVIYPSKHISDQSKIFKDLYNAGFYKFELDNASLKKYLCDVELLLDVIITEVLPNKSYG